MKGTLFHRDIMDPAIPILNGIHLPCIGRRFKDRVQKVAIIGDIKMDSLEHRGSVDCVSLFYRFYNGMCSSEIREHVSITLEKIPSSAIP